MYRTGKASVWLKDAGVTDERKPRKKQVFVQIIGKFFFSETGFRKLHFQFFSISLDFQQNREISEF